MLKKEDWMDIKAQIESGVYRVDRLGALTHHELNGARPNVDSGSDSRSVHLLFQMNNGQETLTRAVLFPLSGGSQFKHALQQSGTMLNHLWIEAESCRLKAAANP